MTDMIPAARIADQGGVVADDQHGLMAEFLEQAQLSQRDSMAEVNVDSCRIDAILHT